MTEATSKSRPAARKRGGRARGQMSGGMLASLSAAAADAKPKASSHHAHTSSSLMNLHQNKDVELQSKKVTAFQRRGEEEVTSTAHVPSHQRLRREQNDKTNVTAETSRTEKGAIKTPPNENLAAVMQSIAKSPMSTLSSVADNDDDALTPRPPLTSVKLKNRLQSSPLLLSPISFAGLSPANIQGFQSDRYSDDVNNDLDEDEQSYVHSTVGSDESLEHYSSHSSSSNDEESTSAKSNTNESRSSNMEVATNPRIVICRKVAKDFHGKTYVGTIVGYDDSDEPAFWQVEYTDGDGEDFSYGELIQGIKYFEEKFGKDGESTSCDGNYCYVQSVSNDDDDDECFDDEETDDDEDYSIEQESDSEDELEIDEGVDSEKKDDGKYRGKKGSKNSKTKLAARNRLKSDTETEDYNSLLQSEDETVESLDECKVDLGTKLDDDEIVDDHLADDDVAIDFDVGGNSTDNVTEASAETEDSDPVAVEVQSEEGVADDVSDDTNRFEVNVDEVAVEEATLGPHEPTTFELFAVVDQIFLESDTDTVTVKDVIYSVAAKFGLEKIQKQMKKTIRDRLTDLIQDNVQPTGVMKEANPDDNDIEDHNQFDQEDCIVDVAERLRIMDIKNDDNSMECEESRLVETESPSGRDSLQASYCSHEDSHANVSQSDSVRSINDQLAMSDSLFQNLSPEYSIHSLSRTENDNLFKMQSILSPLVADKPKKRSVVVKGKWSLGPEIGIGSFGRVHTGLNALNGSIMAVKVLIIPSDNKRAIIEDLQREIDVMKTLNHPNIVRYLGAEVDNSRNILNIFQEWVPGGSVSSLLKKFGPFSVDIVKTYIQQVLKGLDYLHSNGIIHRDIKGGNILVSNDGSIKLADFGASKKVEALGLGSESDKMEMTMRGTPYFMAPEVFEEKYGQKADIWSVGGVIYQMVTGVPPWKSLGFNNPISLFIHIKSHSSHPELPLLKNCDRNNRVLLESILSRCFQRSPFDRPLASELLRDSFFSTSVNRNATPPSPNVPLLSPSLRSPLQIIVEDQELNSSISESLCYSLKQAPENKTSDASLTDSLCYSLTLTSPLKVNDAKNRTTDSSDWPEWAKMRHEENKENATSASKSKTKGNVNPFAKKKPFADLHTNTTYSSGAAH